jgi:hypothetical protein
MRIISNNPVMVDDNFSEARGTSKKKQERQSQRSTRKLKSGTKEERKEVRGAKREERQAKRKARRNARKLKLDKNRDGKITFKDFIPKLRKETSSTGQARWVKDNPDGTKEVVPDNRVEEVKGSGGVKTPVDGDDLKGATTAQSDTNGNGVTASFPETAVEEAEFEDGTTGYVKKDDLDGGSNDKGMSKGLKIGLIIGGVVVATVITILVVKSMKSKSSAKGK